MSCFSGASEPPNSTFRLGLKKTVLRVVALHSFQEAAQGAPARSSIGVIGLDAVLMLDLLYRPFHRESAQWRPEERVA